MADMGEIILLCATSVLDRRLYKWPVLFLFAKCLLENSLLFFP